MLNRINLQYVKNVLGAEDLMICLFPTHKHPVPALKRQIDLDLPLDENQMARVALALHVGARDLLGSNFKKRTESNLVFNYLGYRVFFNTDTFFVSILSKTNNTHTIFVGTQFTPMSELFTHIQNFRRNEQSKN